MKEKTIVILGAGRLAASLAPALARAASLVQVYSRTPAHARALAARCGCAAASRPEDLATGADYYVLAVSDDAIPDVIAATADTGGTWLHTSGTCPMDVFAGHRKHYGTLQIVMSFSTDPIPLDDVPMTVDAPTEDDLRAVTDLASAISNNVRYLPSDKKPFLHLASVLTNNFSNHLLAMADDLLKSNGTGLDVRMVLPMMQSMLNGIARGSSPRDLQSGPARRGDLSTVNRHMALLEGDTLLHDTYNLLTRGIAARYGNTLTDERLRRVRGIAFDVDGVLSPSTITMHPSGEPMRGVNIKDGYALQLAVKLGLKIAIISGATVEAVRMRYASLGIKDIWLGASHKLPVLEQWMREQGLEADEVMMVGDDIPDVPAMRRAGVAVAPSDAAPEARDAAQIVSVTGGHGVARDVIERVLKARGLWLDDTHAFGW